MISCTQFIPAYSELFRYIEERHSYGALEDFWRYLFKPDGKGIPLVNHVRREGLRGCFSYWAGSLNEEAASFTMYLNEKRGYFLIEMHRCPSKGRLLELQDRTGIEPYVSYCLHCDYYRYSIEPFGLKYIYNFSGVDRASCSILVYNPEVFDGRVVVDSDTVVMDRDAAENDYFHRDFHSSMNGGVEYLATTYGSSSVVEYLSLYTDKLYGSRVKGKGLSAIAAIIAESYELERAKNVLIVTEGESSLEVQVSECPAIKHLRATGRTVSDSFYLIDEVVYTELARLAGVKFEVVSYDKESGAANYLFTK